MTKKEKCELWRKKLSEYYAGLKPIAKDLEEQKQEIKLEDVFNDEKKQGVKELIDKHTLEEASWKFNPLKKLDGEFLRHAFKEGAKWEQERMFELVEEYNQMLIDPNVHDDHKEKSFKEWFEQFKKDYVSNK
jgi:hypothetical protein